MVKLEEIAHIAWEVTRTNLLMNPLDKITDLPAGAYTIVADTSVGALAGIYSAIANGGTVGDICFALTSRTAAGFVYSIFAVDAGFIIGKINQIRKDYGANNGIMSILDNTKPKASSPKAL